MCLWSLWNLYPMRHRNFIHFYYEIDFSFHRRIILSLVDPENSRRSTKTLSLWRYSRKHLSMCANDQGEKVSWTILSPKPTFALSMKMIWKLQFCREGRSQTNNSGLSWLNRIVFFFSQELQNDITILQIHEACWVLCISVGVEESAKGRHMDKSSCLVVGMWGKHWSVVHREKEGD